MGSIDRNSVDEVLAAAQTGVLTLDFEFDLTLEHETHTDKKTVKLVPCRECKRPLVVTTFFAPAKALCDACKGESPNAHVASVGQPIPGSTDPAKAVNLADCLINSHFAFALCPVHPDDDTHVMELKSVLHNDNYGPGVFTAKGEWRQLAKGETVMHQCTVCNATVGYSTVPVVQYRRQNEVMEAHDFGPPHRNSLLGVRGKDPTKAKKEVAA